MSTDPDQIRREIEATRNSLSSDVDALAYKVSPSRIVDDRKQRARSALQNVRDKVMGTASDLGHGTGHAAHSVGDRASSAASSVSDAAHSAAATVNDAAHSAPRVIRQKSQGNPLAAGLIAFGVGWLASSLIPASRREQQAATQVKAKVSEHSGAVKEKLGEVASELREPVQQAAESVRSTAQDAVHAVKDDTKSAANDVKDQARHHVSP
ncbi:DUF3618 domain-containing protein [Micromonospora sp. NPDC049645]|uniref:DUF3618 domain-containing protein n=1 Tax=Micromonospora sp. NPDC049645 TaxID=3155508 RepID=UPI0034385A10